MTEDKKQDDCPPDWDDYNEEEEFTPCSGCDGHPACEDFGCAIEAGLGEMVKKNLDNNGWSW